MGKIDQRPHVHRISTILLVVTIFGTIILPPLYLIDAFPAFEISDLTFPVLVILSLLFWKTEMLEFITNYRSLILSFGLFLLVVVVSIIVNGRISQSRDWFEVLKYIKFLFFFILFAVSLSFATMRRVLIITFMSVLIFNLLHYFNVLNFNLVIEPFYAAPHHLDYFGLNSLGEPSTKRALGTLGNPNTNGILFLLFILVFLPRHKDFKNTGLTLLSLSILGLFLCQSRTGVLAYFLILAVYFLMMKSHWKTIFFLISVSILSFLLLQLSGNLYLNSIANPEIMQSASRGRLEQWIRILESMPGHWVVGHAPSKEYFEQNDIYSESEYFLILFRYGILGIGTFLMFWWFWLKTTLVDTGKSFKLGLLVALTYLLTAITNNPLQSPKIALLLSVVMAFAILEKNASNSKI
jgi:hypothetical protein